MRKIEPNITLMDAGDDIFKSSVQVLTNTVNCAGYMGKGLAKLFKSKYGSTDMFDFYKEKCLNSELRVGEPILWPSTTKKKKSVLLFPTKNRYQNPSKITWIEDGLDYLRDHYKEWGIESIAIPALGCTNGGLRWDEVETIIIEKLGGLEDLKVEIYPPHEEKKEKVKNPTLFDY
ncbi:hypothetical protein AZH53_09875 [Methanomicrobiaceae archaeon CYW5]|uniref:macro domain-containing protein n=1 Tax=Methanovulcanius yangii TaxID=1789227 RepID=UPI0029CA6566|nr:macro domain-containing protein [Methanovulcanius yangii]MBT8508712.1 hypothetical protein [Methanovulcanius yangii]